MDMIDTTELRQRLDNTSDALAIGRLVYPHLTELLDAYDELQVHRRRMDEITAWYADHLAGRA